MVYLCDLYGITPGGDDNVPASHRFYLCPIHNRWMVPERKPFEHWKCPVVGCRRMKAAKMRTETERRIFCG